MADILPNNIPAPGETVQAIFNYNDIVSGQGYADFYLMSVWDGSADNYILRDTAIRSTLDFVSVAHNSNTDYEFSSGLFNSPRLVLADSKIIIELSSFIDDQYTGSETMTQTLTCTLYKNTGEVVSAVAKTHSYTNSGANIKQFRTTIVMTPSSDIMFKIGDYVKLKVNVASGASSNSSSVTGLNINPLGEDSTGFAAPGDSQQDDRSTISKISIPFKNNL